ncbi:MAG: cadmium-translocating P-type ATPase [Proteobacteria bacterium]|nr:cadmium-translocating P-type ATPase [Desulfobulbaceae bacterium]MBU4153005.1 cadmium-translocating P-type ATPase [Pseudomonadota bacterium]
MNRIQIERYDIDNLDCATCAAKIEQELKKTDGVEDAVLDFATLTLLLKATDTQKALAVISRIEPQVKFTRRDKGGNKQEAHDHSTASNYRKEIGIIITSGIIFVGHMVFENRFHALLWPWVEYVVVCTAYFLAGWNVFLGAIRSIRRGLLFDENVLMIIATVGAMAIHALSEAVGVMLFFKVGELLQNMAVSKARRSIRGVLAARPDRALVKNDSGFSEISPGQVKVGDIILVKPGEKVALDGEVVEGISQVDTSPLTGEPVPVQARPGDSVMAGTINTASALMVRVTKPFEASSIARVLELVESATARKAVTEKFITTFARYYTPAVVAIATIIAVVPPLLIADAQFTTWVYRALVILVISCPCALVVSIPLGYFGGIGWASRSGILVKGSMFIDVLASVKTVVFDKTGTLTRGVFMLDRVVTVNGFSADYLLQLTAAAELHSTHPIGKSIVAAMNAKGLAINEALVSDHVAIPGIGVSTVYEGKSITVGSDALLHKMGIDHEQCIVESTVAHVVVDNQYAGYIVIGDQLKADAKQAIRLLRQNGVDKIIMLTGDNESAAAHVAKDLELDQFHAGLLPEDKVRIFEQICAQEKSNGKVAFVGDGINDAPVLARADVGVAMGALGSDAAIETADVVLMTDSPAKMAEAIRIARHTRRIVWQNIALAFSVKGLFLLLGALGMASMWEAVFADMGTALLALLNASRVFRKVD